MHSGGDSLKFTGRMEEFIDNKETYFRFRYYYWFKLLYFIYLIGIFKISIFNVG